MTCLSPAQILPHALFERFVELMEIGILPPKEPGEPGQSPKKGAKEQKTKLTSFFAAKPSVKAEPT